MRPVTKITSPPGTEMSCSSANVFLGRRFGAVGLGRPAARRAARRGALASSAASCANAAPGYVNAVESRSSPASCLPVVMIRTPS